MQISEIMQQDVATAEPEMSLAHVQRLMHDRHIRHVPVVSGKKLVGIVTDRDLREASPSPATTLSRGEISYQMDTTAVKTCMTQNVRHIAPTADVKEGARMLLEHAFGCLPVVEGNQLVGLVSEMDFLRAFLNAA